MRLEIIKPVMIWKAVIFVLAVVSLGVFIAVLGPERPASAAAVKCYAATSTGHGNEIDCTQPGIMATLLSYTGAGSLEELADRCFAVSIDWAEIDCEEDVARANAPRCIKENPEARRYESVECAASGAEHNFEQQKCYAITADNVVTEYGCLDRAYIDLSSGTYPGGRYDPADRPSGEDNTPITCDSDDLSASNCLALSYLISAINITTASVVAVVVGSIIFAGIQYSSSRDDPQAIAKAKHRILQAVIALLIFLFGFGVLQWLIPGGLFS